MARSRHRSGMLAAMAAAMCVAGLSAPTLPASALEQPAALRVEKDQTVEATYPPLPAMFPLSPPENLLVKPDDCRTAAYCDVVPLEVVLPAGFSPEDEFFVEVELNWETAKIPEGPTLPEVGPVNEETAVNDVDLYLWDVPAGDKPVASGASQDVPELMRVFTPTKGTYEMVVLNFSGPNTGYKLKATYKPETIVPPFELLDPTFEVPPPPVVDTSATPIPDLSGVEEPDQVAPPRPSASTPVPVSAPVFDPAPAAPAPEPRVPLTPVDVAPDADFAEFSDEAFDDELAAAPDTTVLRERVVTAVGPATPASTGSLLFWLAGVPLLLVAAAGVWLRRRESALLRLR